MDETGGATMTRAGLYARVSTEEQTEENQVRELLQLARARGWEPVVYRETMSGAVRDRPELDRLLGDARAGRLGAVVVWALDRVHRTMVGCITTVLELDRLGVEVVSIREPWLDTAGPVRSLLLAIFGWVAEQERARLIERTRAGLARAREKGTRSGKAIGRPRASTILLSAAAERVRTRQAEVRDRLGYLPRAGNALRTAARDAGVSEATLRRWMRQNPPAGVLPGQPGKTGTKGAVA
jgi:DNA invertase Pin-like site-specific DNA recombinase